MYFVLKYIFARSGIDARMEIEKKYVTQFVILPYFYFAHQHFPPSSQFPHLQKKCFRSLHGNSFFLYTVRIISMQIKAMLLKAKTRLDHNSTEWSPEYTLYKRTHLKLSNWMTKEMGFKRVDCSDIGCPDSRPYFVTKKKYLEFFMCLLWEQFTFKKNNNQVKNRIYKCVSLENEARTNVLC